MSGIKVSSGVVLIARCFHYRQMNFPPKKRWAKKINSHVYESDLIEKVPRNSSDYRNDDLLEAIFKMECPES